MTEKHSACPLAVVFREGGNRDTVVRTACAHASSSSGVGAPAGSSSDIYRSTTNRLQVHAAWSDHRAQPHDDRHWTPYILEYTCKCSAKPVFELSGRVVGLISHSFLLYPLKNSCPLRLQRGQFQPSRRRSPYVGYCVHSAEDSNDKERGCVPKMINDLSEKYKYRSLSVIRLGVGLEFFNSFGYFSTIQTLG